MNHRERGAIFITFSVDSVPLWLKWSDVRKYSNGISESAQQ